MAYIREGKKADMNHWKVDLVLRSRLPRYRHFHNMSGFTTPTVIEEAYNGLSTTFRMTTPRQAIFL